MIWSGYADTDPTAWVALSDTINDVLIEPGSLMIRRSAITPLATRLEADIAHPMTRSTGKPTRRIRYKELRPLQRGLAAGYWELLQIW